MSRQNSYDPSAPGRKGTIFGLPFSEKEASIVLCPVSWDVTTSYSAGTSNGPRAILDASSQLDLEIPNCSPPWEKGIWMAPIDDGIFKQSRLLRKKVEPYFKALEEGSDTECFDTLIKEVNTASGQLKETIKKGTHSLLNQGKKVGLIGGDHSCPLGYMEALAEVHGSFGVLQVDAHMDLRKGYEGFVHSHASIMYNALQIEQLSNLVQVGVRDFCEEELDLVKKSDGRVKVYYDQILKQALYEGVSWKTLVTDIIDQLPDKVYVSFDIDGLNPHLCTGTGTPVPGGLEFNEAIYLLNELKLSGKTVIGFDLCEVSPKEGDNEWNANVGARLLYNLCAILNA